MRITDEELKKIAEIINEAERPMMYIGGGVRICKAEDELIAMLNKTDMPVMHHTALVGSYGPHDYSHHDYSHLPEKKKECAAKIVARADVLITVGVPFKDQVAELAKKADERAVRIQVDINRGPTAATIPVDYILAGDIHEILEKLVPILRDTGHTEWIEEINNMLDEVLLPPHVFIELFGHYAGSMWRELKEEYECLLEKNSDAFADAVTAEENKLNLLRRITVERIKETNAAVGLESDPDFIPGKTFVDLFGDCAEMAYRCIGKRFWSAVGIEPNKYANNQDYAANRIELLRELIWMELSDYPD